jgi:hypothetical protein
VQGRPGGQAAAGTALDTGFPYEERATVVAMATETSTGGALQRVAGMNKVQY